MSKFDELMAMANAAASGGDSSAQKPQHGQDSAKSVQPAQSVAVQPKIAYNPMDDIMHMLEPKAPTQQKQYVTGNAALDAWRSSVNTLANERKEKEAKAKAEAEQKEHKQLQSQLDRIDANRAYVTTTEQNDALEKERASVVQRMREIDGTKAKPTVGEKVVNAFKGSGSRTTEGFTPEQEEQYTNLLLRLDSVNASAAFALTAEQSDAIEKERKETLSALHQLDTDAGRAARAYDARDRADAFFKSWGKGTSASYTNAAASGADVLATTADKLADASSEKDRRVMDNPYAGWATDELSAANFAAAPVTEETSGLTRKRRADIDAAYETADKLLTESEQQMAKAKYGTSAVGSFALDAAKTGMDILADTAASAVGVPGLANMAARVYGGESQQARLAGDDVYTAAAKGLKSALIEVATEKVAGPFEKAYGKTALSSSINKAVDKLNASGLLKWAADAAGEGFEEGMSDVLNTVADHIFGWDSGENSVLGDIAADKDEIVYDMLLGAFVGAFGGAGNLMNTNAQSNAAPVQQNTQTEAQGAAPAAVSEEARALMESILAGGRVNTTTANTILSTPQLAQAFTEVTGISLTGNTADMRAQISGGAREYAYSQLQTSREESARAKARENLPAEMARQNEQLAALSQEEAARDADWTQRREEMENYGSYDSYVRGIVRNGGSFAEAGEIARTPELRATWEKITGQTLPDSTNKARAMVMNYRADVAMPQRSAQQPQARANVQEGNLAPAAPANVKQGGSDELNSALNLNSRDATAEAQKNTAPTQETESTAVNDDPAKHTPEEQARIEEYKAATDENLVNYIETVRDNPGAKIGRYSLKPVSDKAAADIKAITGVDVSGNKTVIEPRIIEHILKRHGKDGAANNSMRDVNDIARIQYVIDNYDNVEDGGRSSAYQTVKPNGKPGQAQTVKFSKAINGTYYVIEAVPDTKAKTVFVTSAYLSNKKAGDMQTANAEATRVTSETKNAQSPVYETSSKPGSPQASGVTGDVSIASIPTTGRNVNSENGGNAGRVFEPTYNRDAKPYTKEKLSQFWTNTLRETESAAGASEDVSRPLSYLPKTEKQSLAEAASRLRADRQGTIEKLISAEAWSGVQVDAAAQIGDELYREGAKTGNYEAYTTWRKIMDDHVIDTARGIQATAKYSRHNGENALSSIASAISDSSLTPQQRTDLINRVGGYAERFDKITRGTPDTGVNAENGKVSSTPSPELVSLIEDMARERGTWTFTDNTYSDLLKKQSNTYLKEYAYQQLLGMGNDKLAKTSVADKAKAVQSMAQLSSVATFARNIGGNVTFGAVDTMTQDGFGVALDWLLSKATGKRTVGLDKGWFSSEARKGAVDAMQKSILEVAGDVDMDGGVNRYGQSSGRAFKMDSSPTERFFSRWQQLMGYSLTTSDKFSRGAIEAEQVRGLNAIKDSGLTNDEMQALAQAMANYRLFQNQGIAYSASKATHDFFNLAGFGGKVGAATRQGGFGLGDFVNTYPGVPANLGVKVLEYSPANIVKGGAEMVDVIIKAKQGKLDVVKQQQAVMDVARGLAGVPAFALFAALTKAGFIRNWDDEDDLDVRQQNAAEGKTGIQFNLDGALRYLKGDKSLEWRESDRLDSIGWLEPINGFMAVGSLMANEPEGASKWAYVGDIAEGAVQAFLDIPVMSNISGMVDTFNYSKADSTMGKVGEAAVSYGGDLLTSFIPSAVRGVAKGLDPYYRDTTGDTAAETALNRVKLAIPGLRETLPVKLDNFGQPKMYSGNTIERLADTLMNPGTRTTIRQSEASKVLEDLYKATGDAGIYPDRKAPSSIKLDEDDESTRLTTAEKRLYQRTAGNLDNSLIESLADNSLYNAASDKDKASIVKELLSYSDDTAKKQYAQRKNAEFTSNWDKVFDADIPDVPDYVASKQALQVAKNKPEKADYSYLDKVIDNYGLLSAGSKELLRDSGLSAANLLYADSKGIGSKAWYDTHNAIDGTSAVAAASSVSRNFKGSDEEKLDALRTMNSYTMPDKETGKQSAIVRRYEAAMNYGVSFDDWTKLEETIVNMFGSGTPNKSEIYAAARKALPDIPQYKVYSLYKKDSANENKVDFYDEYFASLYEPTGGKVDKDFQSMSYEEIMDALRVPGEKVVKAAK